MFFFQYLGNGRKDKNGRVWTTFGLKNQKNSNCSEIYPFFSLSKPKVVYLRPILSSLSFPKFYVFWA